MFSKLVFISSLALAAATPPRPGPPGPPPPGPPQKLSNSDSSLTLFYQNNLNVTDDANHVGFILLDPKNRDDASKSCQAIGEKLVSKSLINTYKNDFTQQLAYNAYARRALPIQLYYIEQGVAEFSQIGNKLNVRAYPLSKLPLPVLCTQSNKGSTPSTSSATPNSLISIASGGNTYVGFRNQKSFRFLGLRYADKPKRWTYSKQFSPKGQTLNATAYAPQCPQFGSGDEDCLFLNIQTPYIPKQGPQGSKEKKDLRPVVFWIHGGGYVGGSNRDSQTDGGQIASREDVVTVQITYRLGNLGFLAIPGTAIKGNFGIGDQITALDWTIENIANFGGDPKQITIVGDSAGAASVRVLLGSPKAVGKFQGALALSSLGGGQNLGLSNNYGTYYAIWRTIEEQYTTDVGQNLFQSFGCNQASIQEQISCLEKVDALALSSGILAQRVVQDGTYVNTRELNLVKRNSQTAHVPTMFGVTRDEGASIGANYPQTPVTNQVDGIAASLGISKFYAQDIVNSKLFPIQNTGNITFDSFNVSARVATDNNFRCVDQATVYAGAVSDAFESGYFFEFTRTIGGYDPNGLGGPPVTPGYPNGNPNLPYFRYHSSSVPWILGNLDVIREPADLYSVQLQVSYFANFFKQGQPNPSESYLRVRGYDRTLDAIKRTGPWIDIQNKNGPIRYLDWPSVAGNFRDVEQCKYLNYSLSYYFDKK